MRSPEAQWLVASMCSFRLLRLVRVSGILRFMHSATVTPTAKDTVLAREALRGLR